MKKVKIPKGAQVYPSKNDLALELSNAAQRCGFASAPVLVDSAYGNDFMFRAALQLHELS